MKERDAFLDVIGYSPQAKILGVLILGREFEYSKSDIIRAAEMKKTVFDKTFPRMIELQLIVSTRRIRKIQLYQINRKNAIAQALMQLHKQIIMDVIQKYKLAHPKRAEEAGLIA